MMNHTFLTNKKDIEAWLQRMGIKNYTIARDLSVRVKGDVELGSQNLEFIPVQFSQVSGHFVCDHNRLTSLKGCPHTVGKSFGCGNNQLTSLEFGPQKVGAGYFANDNKLTTLRQVAKIVPGSFMCSNNQLTSLEGGPQEVHKQYYLSSNPLNTLAFCPQAVGYSIYVDNTPLSFSAKIIEFEELYSRHLEELRIYQEKEELGQSIQTPEEPNRLKIEGTVARAFKL